MNLFLSLISDAFVAGRNGGFAGNAGAVPFAVAVNSAHVYWANNGDDSIGRANLDGSGVDNHFITGVTQPTGVAVTSQYIFWSSLNDAVGRADLDGSNKKTGLISSTTPCGVAVDSGHVYWAQDTGPPALIGRSDTSQRAASGCSPGKWSFATASAPFSSVPRYFFASGQWRAKPV